MSFTKSHFQSEKNMYDHKVQYFKSFQQLKYSCNTRRIKSAQSFKNVRQQVNRVREMVDRCETGTKLFATTELRNTHSLRSCTHRGQKAVDF